MYLGYGHKGHNESNTIPVRYVDFVLQVLHTKGGYVVWVALYDSMVQLYVIIHYLPVVSYASHGVPPTQADPSVCCSILPLRNLHHHHHTGSDKREANLRWKRGILVGKAAIEHAVGQRPEVDRRVSPST